MTKAVLRVGLEAGGRELQERAAKEAWGEWIADMGEWHVFGGLTYDQRRRVGSAGSAPAASIDTLWCKRQPFRRLPGREVVFAHARRWLRDSARELGRPVEAAVLALEYQKNGWPHLHPLLRLPGGLQTGDLVALGQSWYDRHGYARLESPRSRSDVCGYAAKYLSKDVGRGDVIFWPLRGSLTTHQDGF